MSTPKSPWPSQRLGRLRTLRIGSIGRPILQKVEFGRFGGFEPKSDGNSGDSPLERGMSDSRFDSPQTRAARFEEHEEVLLELKSMELNSDKIDVDSMILVIRTPIESEVAHILS
jgi:hypothetical protein